MTKQEIRRQVAEQIKRMKGADKDTSSLYVCLQIIGTEEWQRADCVLLYAAMPDEVDVALLLQDAYDSGKQVILPVVNGEDLLLRRYDPSKMAVQGPFHINEPTDKCEELTDLSAIDLAIIPGRAFTSNGLRLGRGKGYYDRLLQGLQCPKWGVGFACQLKPSLPTDEWDVPLQRVIV